MQAGLEREPLWTTQFFGSCALTPWHAMQALLAVDMPATVLVTEGPRPAGTWSAIVTLLNCAVGAGVLSFPLAFSCTGWLAGLVTTVLVAATEAFTLYVLSRYAEHTRSSNYSELVSEAWAACCFCAGHHTQAARVLCFWAGPCLHYPAGGRSSAAPHLGGDSVTNPASCSGPCNAEAAHVLAGPGGCVLARKRKAACSRACSFPMAPRCARCWAPALRCSCRW
jgi:hypothetical protein